MCLEIELLLRILNKCVTNKKNTKMYAQVL